MIGAMRGDTRGDFLLPYGSEGPVSIAGQHSDVSAWLFQANCDRVESRFWILGLETKKVAVPQVAG